MKVFKRIRERVHEGNKSVREGGSSKDKKQQYVVEYKGCKEGGEKKCL